jgi:hypothetical protein
MSEEKLIKEIKDMIEALQVQGFLSETPYHYDGIDKDYTASDMLQEFLLLHQKDKNTIEKMKKNNK